MSNKFSKKIIADYINKKDIYKEFSRIVHDLMFHTVKSLENGVEMKCQHISSREKSLEKLKEKIDRKAKKEGKIYKNLEDVEDLAGVRVVFYLESDKDKFISYLIDEFNISYSNIDQKNKKNGYRATHIIFELDEKRKKLSEYSKYAELKCEIQVTSSLFHVWSEIEHDTIYKPGENKENFVSLGLGDLQEYFGTTLSEKIRGISVQFESVKEEYVKITNVHKFIFGDQNLVGKGNDELFEELELSKEFTHKVPKQIFEIYKSIFEKEPTPPQIISQLGKTNIYGKEHIDLIVKIVDIINHTHIKYLVDTKDILHLVLLAYSYDCSNSKKYTSIKKEVLTLVDKLVTYNIHAVNHPQIGIEPQRVILEEITSWSEQKQDMYREIVLMMLERIVYIAVEGISQTEVDTYTISRGALIPDMQVYSLRKKSLELVFAMYTRTNDVTIKLNIVHVIDRALDIPDSTGEENYYKLKEMVISDLTEHILPWYTAQIFDTSGAITVSYPVVHAIEEQMQNFVINPEHYNIHELNEFLEKIGSDDLYQLYRLLTSDRLEYKEREEKNKQVDNIVAEITVKNIDEWIEKLSIISKDFYVLERWQLDRFERLIEDVVWKHDIKIVNTIYNAVIIEILPQRAIWSILCGLRFSRNDEKLSLWDKMIDNILSEGNIQLLTYAISSLNQKNRGEYFLREKDIELIQGIVNHNSDLNIFGNDIENQVLRDQLFRLLCFQLRKVVDEDVNIIEQLITTEMSNYSKYLHIYFEQLWMTLHNQDDIVDSLSDEFKTFLMDKLVEVPRLQFGEEIVLCSIGKGNISAIFDVFNRRIVKEYQEIRTKYRVDDMFALAMDRYDAVPYNLHNDLVDMLIHSEDYILEMIKSIEFLRNSRIDSYLITSFYKSLPTQKNQEVIFYFAKKQTKKDIFTAIRLTGVVDREASIPVCIEIYIHILKIKSEKSRDDLVGALVEIMHNTGLVSGNYGFVNAYKSKAKQIEDIMLTEEDSKVISFCVEMKDNFEKRAEEEKLRAEEEKTLRKIKFENGI